ncbi:MAG: glycosyl hydrolase-related protein [Lachnospirales bacterium]
MEKLESVDYIDLIQFAHHDLGWHSNSFEKEAAKSNEEINQVLELMELDENYKWTHEHGRYLYEYLKTYPEKYEELAKRVAEGRFEIGAGYTSPYTSFVPSELLVRQFIYGKKWIEKQFPNYKSNVFYNTDVPGLGAQMAQILKKSGVDYLYASRSWDFIDYGANEFKKWRSLDGTEINSLFMHQYPVNLEGGFRDNSVEVTKKRVEEYNVYIKEANLGKVVPLLCSEDIMTPMDYRGIIEGWNAKGDNYPKMKYETMQNSLKSIFTEDANLSDQHTLIGEWPNKWFYENMASDNYTFMKQREAERYLRGAETLSLLRTIIGDDPYPNEELEKGWRSAGHACHGYAPMDCINEFKNIYENAFTIGKKLYDEQLNWLASKVNTDSSKGTAFIVYNSLSWNRKDVVTLDYSADLKILDENNNEVEYQITKDEKIIFMAEIPALGYKTFYMVKDTRRNKITINKTKWTSTFSNNYYEITPCPEGGALEQVIDIGNKNKNIFSTSKFKIGELYGFQYDGMGAGEQLYIWQPHSPVSYLKDFSQWECVESGQIRTVFETTANETEDGPVTLQLVVYEKIKKIEFLLHLDNMSNTDKRQLRLMFPVDANNIFGADDLIDKSKVAVTYEVPFGAVTVGDEVLDQYSKFNNQGEPNAIGWKKFGSAATEGSNKYGAKDDRNSAIRPREVQNWISSADKEKDFRVIFGSYNLGWDYQDSTPSENKKPVLQPILLSHSCTCHGDGYIWNQPGKHDFKFSMTSSKWEDVSGNKMAIESNHPLDVCIQENKSEGVLPILKETFSFISTENENIIITAIKKPEDVNGKNIVIRFYEAEGRPSKENIKITLPKELSIENVEEVNLIENATEEYLEVNNNVITVPASPWSIETIMIYLK